MLNITVSRHTYVQPKVGLHMEYQSIEFKLDVWNSCHLSQGFDYDLVKGQIKLISMNPTKLSWLRGKISLIFYICTVPVSLYSVLCPLSSAVSPTGPHSSRYEPPQRRHQTGSGWSCWPWAESLSVPPLEISEPARRGTLVSTCWPLWEAIKVEKIKK